MKPPNSHYSNYLISVQFREQYSNDDMPAMIECCENFLAELGNLARADGTRLYSTYSINRGKNGHHAHFTPNWIPSTLTAKKYARNQFKNISRYTVTRLLDANGFIVDNPKEAIKRVTHDKKRVTDYVIHQPKPDQLVKHVSFYEHPISGENHSCEDCSSISRVDFFAGSGIGIKSGCIQKVYILLLISIYPLLLIISIMALLL